LKGVAGDLSKEEKSIAKRPQHPFQSILSEEKNQVESNDFTGFFPLIEGKCPSSGTVV
jgi:hypothetical protein